MLILNDLLLFHFFPTINIHNFILLILLKTLNMIVKDKTKKKPETKLELGGIFNALSVMIILFCFLLAGIINNII